MAGVALHADDLRDLLSVSRVSKPRTGKAQLVPAYGMVRLKAEAGVLSTEATDGDTWLSDHCEVEGDDTFDLMVPTNLLNGTVAPATGALSLTEVGGALRVGGATIAALPGQEWPSPNVGGVEWFEVDGDELAGALRAVDWARSREAARENLLGVQLDGANGRVAATTGHVFAMARVDLGGLPSTVLAPDAVKAVIAMAGGPCKIGRAGGVFVLERDTRRLVARAMSASFPDVGVVVERESASQRKAWVEVVPKLLAQEVKRAALYVPGGLMGSIRLSLGGHEGWVGVQSLSTLGSYDGGVKGQGVGAHSCWVNPEYLEGAMMAFHRAGVVEVVISVGSVQMPVLRMVGERGTLTVLLAPKLEPVGEKKGGGE